MRALALMLASMLVAGCGGDDTGTQAGRGPFRGPVVATPPPPTTTTTPASRARHDYALLPSAPPRATIAPPSPTAAMGSDTTAAAPTRDLGAELAAAVGSPLGCIDLATARTLHGHLTIQISATLAPTGSVTRATASGALPPTALECVRSRALAVHLATPIDGAPRTVSTALSFDVTTTDDTTTREVPVWHQPGAVAEPGIVLPAVGAEGRPTGSVRPDSTLPAVGSAGRPEGSVRPDIVLPAHGGPGTIWPSGALPPPTTTTH